MLNVSSYSHRLLTKSQQHSQKAVIEIWPLKQDIQRGSIIMNRLKDYTDLVWFLRMINPKP